MKPYFEEQGTLIPFHLVSCILIENKYFTVVCGAEPGYENLTDFTQLENYKEWLEKRTAYEHL